ncbi:LytR C-terminal domain-containing protein [Nocardioides sp. JQ2195]|uniref:LytR C-terminal domain-containing protein n=1 Tax=Nocardioides sp. JQ2195 TaxID=2592334 RepID=UPI00143E40A8|nr:LytR C-terminal domain-containing protein [Nocardioides sp. JQ2195]QIX25697.1 LytR C-terminal domain-containing protein [Nocardioides sp. JQ2195]
MRARDDRGVAFPSPLVILSIVAVAMAVIAYVATSGSGGSSEMEPVSKPAPSATASPTIAPEPEPVKKKVKKVNRAKVYVAIFNNSNISGLAGSTASTARDAGWQVVGSDNWMGMIPAPTVYYPPRLKAAAKLLAKDLDITRLMPAVDPMNFDRLTVILTASYSG